jgi:hypothetical protein
MMGVLPLLQWAIFASRLMTPAATGEQVDYYTFDQNLESLAVFDFLSHK